MDHQQSSPPTLAGVPASSTGFAPDVKSPFSNNEEHIIHLPSDSTHLDQSSSSAASTSFEPDSTTAVDAVAATPAKTTPPPPAWKAKAWAIWLKYWFLLGLVFVIVIAYFFPKAGATKGPVHPEYSVKYGITSIIFLLSGLSLKTKDLLISAINYRAHLLVQLTSFIAIPLVFKAVTALVGLSSMNQVLLAGMLITAATPTTISSNVVMTANAGGNESLALFNAAFGNLMGVFISPLIVLILLRNTPESPSGAHGLDYATILRDLGTTILVPIVVGQIYLYFFPRSVAFAKKYVHFPTLNSTCLLILVWSVFCDAFNNNTFSSISAGELIAVGVMEVAIFWAATFFLAFMSRFRPRRIRLLKAQELAQEANPNADLSTAPRVERTKAEKFLEPMSKQDTVAILFCGATKSVAMGIPMIKILYSSSTGSAMAGLLATPLLIYHVEQLFSGAFMVDWLKGWTGRGEETVAYLDGSEAAAKAAAAAAEEANGTSKKGKGKKSFKQFLGLHKESVSTSSSSTSIGSTSRQAASKPLKAPSTPISDMAEVDDSLDTLPEDHKKV